MTGLPKNLAPWRNCLSFFPHELALEIGPWIRRIAPLVGHMKTTVPAKGGEPDGYSGIARRGKYDRLLISDWLLAEEFPDEFARRAAMGELNFLDLARIEQKGGRRLVVLFDVGPGQLGTPRIAHLAALIILHERAMAAKAEFQWGIIQQIGEGTAQNVDPAGIHRLFKSISPGEADDEAIALWRQKLGDPRATDDWWLVGAPRLETHANSLRVSCFTAEDSLHPTDRKITVAIRRNSDLKRSVQLELPSESSCVRLLRNPFDAAVAAPETASADFSVGSKAVFSPDGRRLLLRTCDGGVVALHVPNSPRSLPIGRPRYFHLPPGEELVAAGWQKRRIMAATLSGHVLTLHKMDAFKKDERGRCSVGLPPQSMVQPADSLSCTSLCFYRANSERSAATIIVDKNGRVLQFAPSLQSSVSILWQKVTAAAPFGDNLVFVVAERGDNGAGPSIKGPGINIVLWKGRWDVKRLPIDLSGDGDLKAFFCNGGNISHPEVGLVAVRNQKKSWLLIYRASTESLSPGSDAQVIGVGRENGSGGPGLILIESDRRTINMVGRNFSRKLLFASGEITTASVSRVEGNIAYQTAGGELVVHSIRHNAALFRMRPEQQ